MNVVSGAGSSGICPCVVESGEPSILDHARSPLRVTWRGETECLTVFVEGDVDLVTCADLDSGLAEAERLVTAGSRVVLDLRGVTFLGAAGLRVLVNSQRRCADRGVTFAVLATRRAVTRPIELAGLADQLRLTARS